MLCASSALCRPLILDDLALSTRGRRAAAERGRLGPGIHRGADAATVTVVVASPGSTSRRASLRSRRASRPVACTCLSRHPCRPSGWTSFAPSRALCTTIRSPRRAEPSTTSPRAGIPCGAGRPLRAAPESEAVGRFETVCTVRRAPASSRAGDTLEQRRYGRVRRSGDSPLDERRPDPRPGGRGDHTSVTLLHGGSDAE